MSAAVPRVGGVRCYWALLIPSYSNAGPSSQQKGHGPGQGQGQLELKFAYLDPVLSAHLGQQNSALLQKGVLELIHPAEREQARNDLAIAIASDDLQGSVTRMRFARLSRIRQLLGAEPQDVEPNPAIEAISVDEKYLILDLVLNWVADGLLLAFFHAIKDMDPIANNDPKRRQEGWSNFCGSNTMPENQIKALQAAVASNIPTPPRTRYPPTRVFQLHTISSNPSAPPTLVFSWPPPRPPTSGPPPGIAFDGLYDADEYADLMRGVDMDPNQLAAKPGEVRTNCTTRFGAEHSIRTEGVYRHITSVFIPYDQVIFACFQTTKLYELPSAVTATSTPDWSTPPPHVPPPMAPGRDWRQEPPYSSQPPPPPPPQQPPHHQYLPPPSATDFQHFSQPPAHYDSAPQPYTPQHQRIPSGPDQTSPPPPSAGAPPRSGGSTRPLVRPPGDVDKCRGCGTRESPEWRKGENGVKDLCNACGLKLARAVAKREGRQKPRKKDK